MKMDLCGDKYFFAIVFYLTLQNYIGCSILLSETHVKKWDALPCSHLCQNFLIFDLLPIYANPHIEMCPKITKGQRVKVV